MSLGKEALKVLAESVDLKKLANGLMIKVVGQALDNVVAKTENTLDDSMKAMLWPLLEEEVKKQVDEHLDLVKILKLDEPSA